MTDNSIATDDDGFRHSHLEVGRSSIHVVEAGDPQAAPVLFLHGWPQSWRAWAPVMRLAAGHVHAIAIDLPGIGESTGEASDGSKHAVADIVHAVSETMGLRDLTVVGHDAGAMVAYAYLRAYAAELKAAVIIDVAVAGVPPWQQVAPGAWHFGFHAIPDLPEQLVQGRQRDYLDFFYDAFSLDPSAITDQARTAYAEAYRSDTALTAGFNWYRTFPRDAEDNERDISDGTRIDVPTLLMLSGRMAPLVEAFERGFTGAGLTALSHTLVPVGHFIPEEAPERTWDLIGDFIAATPQH